MSSFDSVSVPALPDVPLRIDRGSAEPEELAAIAVVLCVAHLVLAGADYQHRRKRPVAHDMRCHTVRTACWSGCWRCA
ncbi:acyl-CoA carboxylase subunit epsilon [Streptomyces halobius]|uniref:Acyl-CoA carboxylase subunit epsilon n=1 Tax=Streptomyces halobius TaxID=2879846 RepID=A0ABY4M3W1_9ACTN|nr:acyl-CoA carboxylase subunit epsilon [Streptomyces halobius]UQA90926.1 acyl-CoA carboxylase subunit epsilon [Streptomyces halobius]